MAYQDVTVPPDVRRALGALSLLSPKWHPIVLAVLAHRGASGFNDIRESIPDVSGKVLTDTLEALQDAGLVDRTVLSESPLRVEYALTSAGEGVEGVFDELSAWSEGYLESVLPTVLVAERDRRITRMYSNWLTDRYIVQRVHNSGQLTASLDDDVDVVLFDTRIPGIEPSQVPQVAPTECRTVLLVDDRPDFDLLDVACDDVLSKPLVRESAVEAIERQLSRRGESAAEREHAALSAKRDALERGVPPAELAASDRFADLASRIETLKGRLGGA